MIIRNKTQRLTVLTMLLGMALVVNMIEPAYPLGIPGVKIGLANTLGLLAFYLFGFKEMISINLMRVILIGIFRGNFLNYGFWAAFLGSLLSCLAVLIFTKTTKMSEIGISVAAATFHNIGQILVLMLVVDLLLLTYLPIMLIVGVPSGILVGYLVQKIHQRFKTS